MTLRSSVAAVLISLSIPLCAEVYTLGGSRLTCRESVLAGIGEVSGKPLHSERVVSGKNDLSLDVYSFNLQFSLLASKLKQLKSSRLAFQNSVIRCRTVLENKSVEHLLFVNTGKGQQVVVFRLLLPPGFTGNRNWHPDLPDLPGGAKSELVLELPDRKAVFALFNNTFGSANGNLRAALSNLSSQWQLTANESVMPNSRGAILVGKKNAVMLIGFSDDGTGFFYVKKGQ